MIPNTLEEAIQHIIQHTSEEDMKYVKSIPEKQFLGVTHFFYGMAFRNNWGLWHGSVLAKHFNEMGIYHADEMSGIILASFYRRVNGKDIRLDEQVKYYQDFWKKNKVSIHLNKHNYVISTPS